MKKLHKVGTSILLALAPACAVTAALAPLIEKVLGDHTDFAQVKEYFDKNLDAMKQGLVDASKATPSLTKALNQVAQIEGAFIDNEVSKYWLKTIINLRQERYSSRYWNILYGRAGAEKTNVYQPLKAKLEADGSWMTTYECYTDINGNQVDFYHMLGSYNAWVGDKTTYSKDLASWAGDVAQSAQSIKEGGEPTTGFDDDDLYADVDACNIGLVYSQWKDSTKTATLPMYQYYIDLKDDSERFTNFYTNFWKLDKSSSLDEQVNTLMARMGKNTYLQMYISSIGMSWSSDKEYFIQATRSVITRVLNKM